MRVLLLSAYAAGSHRQWRATLSEMLPECEFEALELPPRHFNWRMRGNALYWSAAERARLEQPYDLLLACSTVDLATLRGLVPALARLPTIVYFHENQFAYPQQDGQTGRVEVQVTSLYSAQAADRLLFNSRYNLETFLAGGASLLDRLPDYVPAGLINALAEKSDVLPVPLQPATRVARGYGSAPLRLQWLGRFEYDKGGDLLKAILEELEQLDVPFELAVTGQQFRRSPAVFESIRETFDARLVQYGYVESRDEYLALLARADIALSTAAHEFQGLAVMEAVQRGAVPVVPDRLAYPEIYPERCRYPSLAGNLQGEAAEASRLIARTWRELQSGEACPVDLEAFEVPALAPRYRAAFEEARARQGNG